MSHLENIARQHPEDAIAQARLYSALNASGEHRAVMDLFESGSRAHNPSVLREYVKAAEASGRLGQVTLPASQTYIPPSAAATSTSSFMSSSSAGNSNASRFPSRATSGSSGSSSGSYGSKGLGGVLGTEAGSGTVENPVVVSMAEPSSGSSFWRTVRSLGMAYLLLAAVNMLFEERGMGGRGGFGGFGGNKEMEPVKETSVRFADVQGVDEAKDELVEIVEYLRTPDKFVALGGKLPKGILLVGPPGTGKTMLARAIAGEAGVPFFYVSGSEFDEMFVGVGARRVRDLFAAAKDIDGPALVFIDEIDAVGGSRSSKEGHYTKMTLNQLLVELDGFSQSDGVIVIAATNFPDALDKALTRPGRFDKMVAVPAPDVSGRESILKVHSAKVPLDPDVDLRVVARGTPGFAGADLANLINIAALSASRRGASTVTAEDLDKAKDRILMGNERPSMAQSAEAVKLTAYHEGGHAIVALYTQGADPIHKATIAPRGLALGMVMQLPEGDTYSVSKAQLEAQMDVAMGGRVAEEMIFGPSAVTTGAESDLGKATRIATAIVKSYGMGKSLGPKVVSSSRNDGGGNGMGSGSGDLSPAVQEAVDAEIREILDASYDRAKSLLEARKTELERLAKALCEHETLTGEDVKAVVAGRAPPSIVKKAKAKAATERRGGLRGFFAGSSSSSSSEETRQSPVSPVSPSSPSPVESNQ